jgi:hypothetical protein
VSAGAVASEPAAERTVRDLEGLRRHDAAAAEGARLEAGDAGLEAGLGGGSSLSVRELGLRSEGHVQEHLRKRGRGGEPWANGRRA